MIEIREIQGVTKVTIYNNNTFTNQQFSDTIIYKSPKYFVIYLSSLFKLVMMIYTLSILLFTIYIDIQDVQGVTKLTIYIYRML